ncbi:MAG: L-serine ammonia-lyase [Acholeplasma sp.]|nr:L-serine ammonia-lyase [Acholeplasma sp.]
MMKSLKELYRVGYGPSSSHTMGPSNAAKEFKGRYPEANKYVITLFNSLALTGKGHMTDQAVIKELKNCEVIFKTKLDETKHPNTLLFELFQGETLLHAQEVYSVGGGKIIFENEEDQNPDLYKHHLFTEIADYCKANNISLYEYVKEMEGNSIDEFLLDIWKEMKESIKRGLNNTGILPGDLGVKRKAGILIEKELKNEAPEIRENRLISAYAFAVNEENAGGGKIVTAPTCGACGVVPAVLFYMQNRYNFSDQRIVEALAVGGLIGNLIKHNASISGAEAGCQAEIGSACSMAAAAHATLFRLTIDQVEYAAEIAMEHHLGLTCDPVNGYVQIPCIERNAVAALRAIDACGLAFFLSDSRLVSFDTVVETMYQTGKDMHTNYRETSQGGLAKHFRTKKDGTKNCW